MTDVNRQFTVEERQRANKQKKRCLTATLVIREVKIETPEHNLGWKGSVPTSMMQLQTSPDIQCR